MKDGGTLQKHILDFFMAPRSVVIVGASRKKGEESFNVIENMKKFGYKGQIYPVNSLAKNIMRMGSYKYIKEIGKPIDLAIISTPREHIPRIVEDSPHLGIKRESYYHTTRAFCASPHGLAAIIVVERRKGDAECYCRRSGMQGSQGMLDSSAQDALGEKGRGYSRLPFPGGAFPCHYNWKSG
jgi:predicted CoA-binding protein